MDKKIEFIKTCGRKKVLTAAELQELIQSCEAVAQHFTALIEEKGSAEGPKVKFLRDEARRVHQTILTQKEPQLPDDGVKKLEECVEVLSQVAVKEPTTKKLHFKEEDPSPNRPMATPQLVATQEEDHEEAVVEDDDDEVDSEMEYQLAMKAERQAHMGDAAWHVRMLHVISLVVLILACVGVVFVNQDQYAAAVTAERRATLQDALAVIIDGLDIVIQSNPLNNTLAASKFLDSLAVTKIAEEAFPFFYNAKTFPLFEVLGIRFQSDAANGDRIFVRDMARKLDLLCLTEATLDVAQPNDLGYTSARPVRYLTSRSCGSQTTGSSIWKKTGASFVTYLPLADTYWGTKSAQASTLHIGTQTAVDIQFDSDTLEHLSAPPEYQSGVQNPLREPWMQSTALWTSFAVAIGFLFFLVISEVTLWASKEEVLSDTLAMVLHGLGIGLVSLIVVIATASITWSFQTRQLNQERQTHIQLVSRIVQAGVTSSALFSLGANSWTLNNNFLNRVTQNSLLGRCGYVDINNNYLPVTNEVAEAFSVANVWSMTSNGEPYSSGITPINGGGSLIFAASLVTAQQYIVTVFTKVPPETVILEGGKRSAGPTLGVFGAQLVLVVVYFFVTPLFSQLPFAAGPVFLEQYVQPFQARRVLFVVMYAVTFATSLAVAFYAVSEVSVVHRARAQLTDVTVAASVASAVKQGVSLDWVNSGMPSFAEALVFTITNGSSTENAHLVAGQTLRFPIPTFPKWESSFFGAALSMAGFTTTVRAPAYFTPLVSGALTADPGNVVWMQTTTVSINNTHGLALQRFEDSMDMNPEAAYRIYASFVFAALLSCTLAMFVIDILFRKASEARDEDESTGLYTVLIAVVLLLPSFAVLIGAGGCSTTVESAMDNFVRKELRWTAEVLRPIVESFAANQLNSGVTNANLLIQMGALVSALNRITTKTVPLFFRIAAFAETSQLDMLHVYPIGGADVTDPLVLPSLDTTEVAINGQLGSQYFSSATPRRLSYALIEINNYVNALVTSAPATFLMIAVDDVAMHALHSQVMTQLFKVAGACVFVVAFVFLVTLWYVIEFADENDFVVLDTSEIFPGSHHSEASQPSAPPSLPRLVRLRHAIFFLAIVAVLIFYTSSVTYASSKLVQLMALPTVTTTADETLRTIALNGAEGMWDYLVTSLTSSRNAFTQFLTTVSSATLGNFSITNATAGAAILTAFQSVAALPTTITAVAPQFAQEDLVLEGHSSYHAKAMAQLAHVDINLQFVIPFRSAYGSVGSYANSIGSDTSLTAIPAVYNATAMLEVMVGCGEAVNTARKLFILERIAVNTFLDFGAVGDTTYAFQLNGEAPQIIAGIRAAFNTLLTKFDDSVSKVSSYIRAALPTDAIALSSALTTLQGMKAKMRKLNSLATTTNSFWALQTLRIKELKYAYYGDNGTMASATALALQRFSDATNAVWSAAEWELVTRQANDLRNYRNVDGIPSPFEWASLRPLNLNEKITALTEMKELLATAIATTVLAIAFGVLAFVTWSYLSAMYVSNFAQEMAFQNAHQHNDENSDTESLIHRTTQRHQSAHARRLLVVVAIISVSLIPIGLSYWLASEGLAAAELQLRDGETAKRVVQLTDDLQRLHSEVMYRSSEAFALGNTEALLGVMELFREKMFSVEAEMLQMHRPRYRAMLLLQAAGANLQLQPDGQTLSVMVVLQQKLVNARESVVKVLTALNNELTTYKAIRQASGNISAALLPLQRIAAQYARKIVAANSSVDALSDILMPMSPFYGTSNFSTYVRSKYNEMKANLSSAATFAEKQLAAHQLSEFPTIIADASQITDAMLFFWNLQTLATVGNNSDALQSFGNIESKAGATAPSMVVFPQSLQTEIQAYFASLTNLTNVIPPATLFSTTPLVSSAKSFVNTSLAEQLTAAAATATFLKNTTTLSKFRLLYSFNRNLVTSSAYLSNVSLVSLLDSVTVTYYNLQSNPQFGLASLASYTNHRDTVSIDALAVAPGPYDKTNAEYVAVGVEWACIVAFWLTFAAFLFIVVDMRVLSV